MHRLGLIFIDTMARLALIDAQRRICATERMGWSIRAVDRCRKQVLVQHIPSPACRRGDFARPVQQLRPGNSEYHFVIGRNALACGHAQGSSRVLPFVHACNYEVQL